MVETNADIRTVGIPMLSRVPVRACVPAPTVRRKPHINLLGPGER